MESDTTVAERGAVWTRHWASDAPHSCVGSYGECYGGAIGAFWNSVFALLTGAPRILDLATGSGALPRLLLEQRPDLPFSVDAIDLAAIEPKWHANLAPAARSRVRFHANQAAEALAFPDGTFDLIVSQYGIEYADLGRSIQEMLRVLAPGGRVALVVHASDSRPVTLAAVELAHLEWLMSDTGLLKAAAAMLEPISRASTPEGRATLSQDRDAEAARIRFNDAQAALRERAKAPDGADVLFEVRDATAALISVAVNQGAPTARRRLHDLETAMKDSAFRLRQLRHHALTRPQFAALCRSLECSGTVQGGELRERGHLMGLTVVLQSERRQSDTPS